MRFFNIKFLVAGLAATALVACATTQGPKPGTKAADFSAKGLDGKTYAKKALNAKGPIILYFIKHDCPINAEMVKYYNEVAANYKGKATFIGVINADKNVAKTWAAQYKPTYPVVLDPDMKIIRAYEAQMSPWATMIDKNGKVSKVWAGASQGYLKEINTSLAMMAKTKAASVRLAGAPQQPSGG
jgi:peroxiredoxin